MRKNLTSADITNITWLNSEYGIGNTTHTFSCEIDSEPSTIAYDLYRHDDGYGFTIHTKPEDIWMSMDTRELEKLDNILLQEAEYGRIIKQLRSIDNADEFQNYRWVYARWNSILPKNSATEFGMNSPEWRRY